MDKKFFKAIIIVLVVLLSLSSCKYTDRIIIDGKMAMQIDTVLNTQIFDSLYLDRGNSFSNTRNDPHILSDGNDIYFINTMSFEEGPKSYYLQHLLEKQIGSVIVSNEFVAELRGKLIGIRQNHLYYLNEWDRNKLYYLDLETYETEALFDIPLSQAHLLKEVFYVSTLNEGDLYKLSLIQPNEVDSEIIFFGSGVLFHVNEKSAFTLNNIQNPTTIRQIDLEEDKIVRKVVGGPYKDIEVSGNYFFYKVGNNLYREPIIGGIAQIATYQAVDKYAFWQNFLVVTRKEGGIYLSNLDGSGIVKLSDDKASSLTVTEFKIFYENDYDKNSIYVIDLINGKRGALLGETITDGGIKFVKFDFDQTEAFAEKYNSFILERDNGRTSGELFYKYPHKNILFAEIDSTNKVSYYRHISDNFSIDEVDALIVISNKSTLLGQYTDGALAYRIDKVLTLFEVGDDTPLASTEVYGRPPSEIKSGSGDRIGLERSWHQMALEIRESVLGCQ